MDIGVHILGSVTSNGSKQDRSGFNGEECSQRSSKLAKTTTGEEEEEAMYSKTVPFYQEHMLSFSDKPEALDFSNKNSLSPFLHQIPPSYSKSLGGYGYGGMMNMKGPFTLTQWAELELQALIYKYIMANVPIPSSLLISIKKSFYPYGSFPHSSFGWGNFHIGLAGGNMDPEPGRCRRTDGKKWRCSRDAVPDQKYCERHINRGRHRSRKHVEVKPSHTTTPSGGSNRSINPCTDSLPNHRVQNLVNVQPKESSVTTHQKNNPFEFGHISSDSLLNSNPSKTYESSFFNFNTNQDKHSGNNNNHNSWPEELKSDWTQLSMSIPIPTDQEKILLSPLRLSTMEPEKKESTWIPISWGNSLGGPLGEVLNSTTSSPTLGSSITQW